MIVAREKKQENIVEYILYMFQIEDLLRACDLNMKQVEKDILSEYSQDAQLMKEIAAWYDSHISLMREERKEQKGHLIYLENIISEMEDLHAYLIKKAGNEEYLKLYQQALPGIRDLKEKPGQGVVPDINVCLNAIYGYLLLKMQNKEISNLTSEAILNISNMLAFLASQYKKLETGEMEL